MGDIGNKEIMAKNIEKYMALHGETRTDLARILDTPYTTVTNWIKANTYPRIDKIEMMAAHWGINKSDLVESSKKSLAVSSEGGCPKGYELLNDANKAIVNRLIADLAKAQSEK